MQTSKPTILIVDDSVTNRRIYTKLSRRLDQEVNVHAFDNPKEVIEWLASNSADLIITDYKMPYLTGDKLVSFIRAHHSDSNIPIIVITAYSDREYRVACLDAGATDFLLSPVDHVEFVARARNLLKLRGHQKTAIHRALMQERRAKIDLMVEPTVVLESREALAQVIDSIPAMISAADRQGNCVFVNALQAAAVGSTPGELVGKPIEMLFGSESGAISRRLDRLVIETEQSLPGREEEIMTDSGVPLMYLTSKVPLRNAQGLIIAVLTTSIDITDRRNAEKHLEHMVNHDPLTGLPNRALLRDRIRRELARGRRGDQPFALHFIDLDRFKIINDSYGHQHGDNLLCRFAELLLEIVDAEDTVARIGGDEFAVLQSHLGGPDDAGQMAHSIISRIHQISPVDDHIGIGASIGITLAPIHGRDADTLLRNSDRAMYAAKQKGGNTWTFFEAEKDAKVGHGARLETEIRTAIARQEFVLHYQPQVDLRSGRIIGAEALLRWDKPGSGLVLPDSFLGVSEETGLILPINDWVIHEVCRQAAEWQKAGINDLRVGLNLSPLQLRRRAVYPVLVSAIETTGIDPKFLDLELTEGILLDDVQNLLRQLEDLKSLGLTLSLDDFGTGYSSLSRVRQFPIDRLKIDRSFVNGLAENRNDLAIARTIIDLGHILNLRVIAEGVETHAQLSLLKAEGCDEVQGYLLGRAIPANEFLERLKKNQGNEAWMGIERIVQ